MIEVWVVSLCFGWNVYGLNQYDKWRPFFGGSEGNWGEIIMNSLTDAMNSGYIIAKQVYLISLSKVGNAVTVFC